MKKSVVAITLAGGVALALDMGSWLCKDCLSFPPPKQGLGVYAYPEALKFLSINTIKAKWAPLDAVTICNGKYCLPLVYLKNGIFLPANPGGTVFDTGTGYKNSPGISRGGGEARPPSHSGFIGRPSYNFGGSNDLRSGTVDIGMPSIVDGPGSIGGSGRHFIVK